MSTTTGEVSTTEAYVVPAVGALSKARYPDIEGLGTDPSGQLWGTSGTQGILYEIDKLTGVGSNGRTIDNGGDYESVDCFAF